MTECVAVYRALVFRGGTVPDQFSPLYEPESINITPGAGSVKLCALLYPIRVRIAYVSFWGLNRNKTVDSNKVLITSQHSMSESCIA